MESESLLAIFSFVDVVLVARSNEKIHSECNDNHYLTESGSDESNCATSYDSFNATLGDKRIIFHF